MKLWLTHPTGNTFVRAMIDALVRGGDDFDFFTTLGISANSSWFQKLPGRLKSSIGRRAYPVSGARMHTAPVGELMRLIWPGSRSVDTTYQDLDAAVARRLNDSQDPPEVVYAYEDGALEQFRAASRMAVRRIYDLPIAYWEFGHRLLREEAERYPAWEPTLLSTRDSAGKLERKTEELQMADGVICPSDFVYESLPVETRRAKACIISPFGSPAVRSSRAPAGPKLRVLFAGAMTQRKGLADLFQAMHLLKRSDVELWIVGAPLKPLDFYRHEFADFHYENTRGHGAMLELMSQCDVLALPSIVEGRALVQQEALACGLPLIVTRNAGGDDLVEEARTGFLVPIRSPHAIAEKIDWFASNRDALEAMREECRRKAAEFTWEDYARRILDGIRSSVAPPEVSNRASSDVRSCVH